MDGSRALVAVSPARFIRETVNVGGRRRSKASKNRSARSGRKVQIVAGSRALSARAPRQRRAGGARREADFPAYLATLIDPDRHRGVKIPDPVTFPSCTWCYEQDGTAITDNNGNLNMVLAPIGAVNSASTTGIGSLLIKGTSGGTAGFTSMISAVTNPTISGVIGQVRVVSALLEVYSTQSPLSTGGRFCSYIIPKNTSVNGATGIEQLSTASSLPYSFTDHAAKGACVRWMPSDEAERTYQVVGGVAQAQVSSLTGGATGAYAGPLVGSAIGLAMAGLGSATTMAWRVVVNYEFLPSSDSLDFVNSQPSPDEPSSMRIANAWLQRNAIELLRAGGNVLGGALDIVLPGLGSLPRLASGFAANAIDNGRVLNVGSKRSLTQGRFPY